MTIVLYCRNICFKIYIMSTDAIELALVEVINELIRYFKKKKSEIKKIMGTKLD